AAQLRAEEIGHLPCMAQVATLAPLIVPPRPALAEGRVRHVGDPVAFIVAGATVEIELVNNRVVAAPIEPRAAIGSYDPAGDTFSLLLTGQGVHGIRDQLAEHVFHMPGDRIHLVAPDVGGGFGPKNFLYPEWVLVLFAARHLRRPVKWVSDRAEDFLSSAQGRDN